MPGSFVFRSIATPSGITLALAVTITVPLPKVKGFLVTFTATSVKAVTVAVPKVRGLPVRVNSASDAITTVPVPSTKGSGETICVIEVADIFTGPIVNTKLLGLTDIITLLSEPVVEKGVAENESNPSNTVYLAVAAFPLLETNGSEANAK